ncbi:MAG: hypothetical protein AAFX94_09950, partial [Myxococcota bacterium]
GGVALPMLASVGSVAIVLVMVLPFSPAALTPLEWLVISAVLALAVAGWTLGARTRTATPPEERARLVLGDFA